MLKVKGSNPGASILKFGLFQFSKWLCLDKNNNLKISVALLVLNDWTGVNAKSYSEELHAVYKWTMAMQFSFEYCIDPKDHKSEEEIKAIAVEGAMRPKL